MAWEMSWSIRTLAPPQQMALLVAFFVHLGIGVCVMLCLMCVRRFASVSPRMPRAILATSLCLFFVCCDLLVAIAFPRFETRDPNFLMHPIRGWDSAPHHRSIADGATVLTDELGMRIDDECPSSEKQSGPSALFVGDSLTLGWGVKYRETFAARSIELLKQHHATLKLHPRLGATAGYDTFQEAHWLEDIGLETNPSFVVLQFCLNDVCVSFDPERVWANRLAGGRFCPGPPLSWSGIGRGIYMWNNLPRTNTGLSSIGAQVEWFGITELLKSPESPRVCQAWDRVIVWLDRFEASCRAACVPMLLIYFPVTDQLSDPMKSRASQARLAEWSTRRGVVFVDMLPEYLRRTSDGNLACRTYFIDLTHPSVEGHRVAGEVLANALERMPVVQSLSKR